MEMKKKRRRIIKAKIKSKLAAHPERSFKDWVVFFSPAYVAIAALFIGYFYGLITTFAFTCFLVYGVSSLIVGLLLQESYPNLFPYLGRNIYHSAGGVMLVIGSLFFLKFTSLLLVLFCILLLFLVGWALERARVETMLSRSYTLKRVKDFAKSSHYEAGSYWLLSSLLLLLFFNINIAYASILILAFGDTAAGFVGRNMGRLKNPLNKKKTIEGSLAFFATSLFAAMLFVSTPTAIIVAFLVAIIESLPLKINDNLTVPLSAGLVMFLLSI